MLNPKEFLLDCMLGTLCKRLRMLGIDTLYYNKIDDDSLLEKAVKENRILVTMDHNLALRGKTHGAVLLETNILEEQLNSLKEKFVDIFANPKSFTRCLICNNVLETITDIEEIREMVPVYVYKTQKKFARCNKCKKIYWPGTHTENMKMEIYPEF